jgi:glycosyltransferase involved in cell wall biosynthesis
LVHLSRREGLPRALPQALAAARPVIAYDCDGAGEVCIEGKTGFLLAPGDLPALSSRILELYSHPELCACLGANGREFVLQRFTIERMVNDIHAVYQKLLR